MNYVTAVADLFLKLNREVTILEPADYLIIAEWEKQEIPLELVLETINETWYEYEDTTIDGLSCFRPAVKKKFEIWLQETGPRSVRNNETEAPSDL